ncbi:MAG: CsbD family protein [Bryobacteraceae bacterium]
MASGNALKKLDISVPLGHELSLKVFDSDFAGGKIVHGRQVLTGVRNVEWEKLQLVVALAIDLQRTVPKGVTMNWDQTEGKWKQMTGAIKEKWGKLTDDDLSMIAGRRDQFVGKVQERYGIAKEEAQKRADEWVKSVQLEDSLHRENTAAKEQHKTHAGSKR